MSVNIKIDVDLHSIQQSLDKASVNATREFFAAMYQEANNLITQTIPITPVDTGALRNSGFVRSTMSGKELIFEVGFGGPSAPYAVYVHENLEAYHEPPTQAKFLEVTANQWKEGLPERIGGRVLAALAVK